MNRLPRKSRARRDRVINSAARYAVEQLERRVLLSSTVLDQEDADALKAGLQGMSDWAETVEEFSTFAQNLPFIGDDIGGATLGGLSLADVASFAQLIQDKLATPISLLGNTPTTDDIKNALEAELGLGTVSIIEAAGEISFDVDASIEALSTMVSLNLGENADALGINASAQFELTAGLDLNFTFGVDLTDGLAGSESFFVKLKTDDVSNPTGFRVFGSIESDSFSFALGGKVGFLEVGIGDGTTDSSIDLDAEARVALVDPDATDGHITLAELLGTSLSSLVTLPSVTGTLDADIPVTGSLGSFSATGTIEVDDSNLFDSTLPTVQFDADDPFKNFKNITPRDAVAMLQNLGASLQGITEALAPVGGVPFLDDAISSVLNFGDEFFTFAGGFFDAVFSGADSYTASNEAPSDGVLDHDVVVLINGVEKTLAAGDYANAAGLATALDGALSGTGVSVENDSSDRIRFYADATGTPFTMRFAGDNLGMKQVGFVGTLVNAEFKFDSIQSFLDRLNALDLLGDVGDLEADYDGTSSDLTFRIRIDQSFEDDFELDFGDELDLLGADFPLSITGHAHIHFHAGVALDLTLGINLTPIGGGFTVTTGTLLKDLIGGTDFFDDPDGQTDFKIIQADGTETTVNLDSLDGNSTIGDLQALIAGLAPTNLTLEIVPLDGAQSDEPAALRLVDHSSGATPLTVLRLNGSLGAKILGLEGMDVIADDGVNQITGAPLHGDSFQRHIFLKEDSSIEASASLEVPDDDKINLIAALGILEVGIVDGDGSLSIETGLVLNDPGPDFDGKVHLDELLSSPVRAELVAESTGPSDGKLSGNATFDINAGLGTVTVTLNEDASNTSLSDLIEDLQDALGATNFSSDYDGTPLEGKQLGDVIFAGSKDGKLTLTGLVGNIEITFVGGDPAEELGFGSGAISDSSLIKYGELSASGSIDLPLTFPGVEFLGILAPGTDPSIELSFSTGSPIDFAAELLNLPDTEDIFGLFDFSEADFLTIISQIVALLQNDDLSLLNQPIPLLDKSIKDILAFADPVLDAFNELMDKIGNLKQSLLEALRGADENNIDPESIYGLIGGDNGNALMGGLEQLQEGLALEFAGALEALIGAIESVPDVVSLDALQMPGRVVAAIGQFKELVSETKALIKSAGGSVSDEVKDLFKMLENKLYALKRSVPGVQQLAHFLFEALGLRDLINQDMITAIKGTVLEKIQDAVDAIDAGVDDAHAAADEAFQNIHDELEELLSIFELPAEFNEDITNLDLVALLDLFNRLIAAIQEHTTSGVLVDDGDIETEPLQLLNEAFGLFSVSFPGRLRFSFADSKLTLGVDFQISKANEDTISLDFALPGDIPVTLETTGQIAPGQLAVGANMALNFGLDFDPEAGDPFFFLFPDTQLQFSALLEATGLSIEAGIGGITGAVLAPDLDGSFVLKKDVDDAANHDPASITLGFSGTDVVELEDFFSRIDISSDGGIKLNFPDVEVLTASAGPLSVTIDPLDNLFDPSSWVFVLPSLDFSNIVLDLSSLFAGIDAFLGFIVNAFESKLLQELPLVGDDLGSAALAIEEFRNFLDQIRTAIETVTEATSAAGIQEALQKLLFDTLGPGLETIGMGGDTFDVIAEEDALNILRAADGGPLNDFTDIDLVVNIDEDGADDDIDTPDDNKNLLTDPDASIEAFFTFAGEETWNPTFDIGFDAFGLVGAAATGGIDLTLAYHAEIGIKLDKQHGFSILLNAPGGSPDLPDTPDDGEDPELEANVSLGFQDGTELELNLFFLTLTATDEDTDGENGSTHFSGHAAVDFDFGGSDEVPLLKLTEIDISPSLGMDIFVDVRLRAGFGDNPNLPTIRADFVADWGFTLDENGPDIGELNLALNNVGLDLGAFISSNLAPILEYVNQFLEPVRPLLDLLQLEVPIVSQLYQLIGQGPFTFLDGIGMLGEGGETVVKVVNILIQVVDFVDGLTAFGPNLFIKFGDFDFGDISNPEAPLDTSAFENPLRTLAEAFGEMDFEDENGDPADGSDATEKLTEANAEDEEGLAGLGISFPIITNPANILKLLLGQDADLITWDIPRMEASFEFSQIFGPIVPPYPIFAKIGGGFTIFLDLFVGLDTRGIRTGVQTGQPGDFLKGFYFGDFTDGSTGDETLEAGIELFFTAGAELNIGGIVKAGVEGGIKATIGADWHDEGTPGKVYLDEILLHLQRGIQCIFDLSGELSAFLGAYLQIIIPLGFTDITIIDVSFTIIEVTLLDFTITCPPLPPPEPATLDGDIVYLNIGDRAEHRQPGAVDEDEVILIRGERLPESGLESEMTQTTDKNGDGVISEEELGDDLNNNGVVDADVIAVIGFGQVRIFEGVAGVVGNAGVGDDEVTSENLQVPVTLTGGPGDDNLVGGNANDSLAGNEGNDEISGMGGNDTVKGDDGNDTLFGNDGADSMEGGVGDDIMYGGNNNNQEDLDGGDNMTGGEGNDQMYGHAGNDTASGGGGADFIGGGVGNDSLSGGNDNDTVLGDDGNDNITGGGGDDQLKGGKGTDNISGGSDHDWIAGGENDDTISGGSGNDSIIGGGADGEDLDNNGDDVIDGNSGNDVITGDDAQIGSVTLLGGAGNDTIEGGSGNDLVYGQGGIDIIYGDDATFSGAGALQFDSANAGTGGNDTVYGNEGADLIVAGDGADWVNGGDDLAVDLILGDNGSITLNASGIVLDFKSSDFSDGGNDTLRGGLGNDVVIGGFGDDYILGNEGHDIVLGDHGRVERNSDNSLKKISSTGTDQGGADTLEGFDGDDTVLGGIDDDSIVGSAGHDVLLGDNGEVNYSSGVLTTILSTNVNHFGDDTITGAAGDDTIIGGSGQDSLAGAGQDDIVLGDNGKVTRDGSFVVKIETTDEASGDDDTILGGNGADSAFGGTGDDLIAGGDDGSIDVLGGDNGLIDLVSGVVVNIQSTDPTLGGLDTITGGDGDDIIFGGSGGDDTVGTGGDSLLGENGHDIIVGDNVQITRDASDLVLEIKTIFPDKGGDDTLLGAAGADTMLGGYGSDSMLGGTGADVMLGDNGLLDYDIVSAASIIMHITTTDPTLGHSDIMAGEDGNDTMMGGTDDEDMTGGNNDDLMFGDHGEVFPQDPSNDNFFSIDTSSTDGGGSDTMYGDADDDTMLGGQQGDLMFGGSEHDDMIGGHNNPVDSFGGRSDGSDSMDGGTGNDAMTGDNARVIRQFGPTYTSPLVRTLTGTVIYDADGNALVDGTHRTNPTGAEGRNITLLDHANNTAAGLFGSDLMAGNAEDDTMFGQLGNDTMRGDGFIDDSGPITAQKSANNATDGDDYMEGNGGNDSMFGDLGQDDMAGGSSNQFGLTTAAMRPDGIDVMYGGDGTDTVRNTLGDTSANGHARDADVMMGDNANIFRLVNVNGSTTFKQFNYDNYGSLKLIPRATVLLDYNPVDPDDNPIGNGDLMHGEAGDDSMHGMTGHDTMFGEGQDDDVTGGVGNDWQSGGTGDDGMLGDDGRIATSRNGTTEPLSGVNTATTQSTISTPGGIQTAVINPTGALKKVVNLTPFSTDPDWAGLDNEFPDGSYDNTSDDLMYGGWGHDSMHGGSGDDAMSGAEALPSAAAFIPGVGVVVTGYSNPVNIGNMLAFNPEDGDAQHPDPTLRAGEFALYDEYNPLTKIVIDDAGTLREFLLNFDASEGPADPSSTSNPDKTTDGNDAMFGDLGNDWLVGGTGRDNAYGGWGNDLMNMDDDHSTNGGLNDSPDTDSTYEDRAYGGAGRDVLIGNTGGDRLIDWIGEFNSYLVPFAPFGMGTVSRTVQPQLPEFLYALSRSDGADPTRAADTGADPARNGEPEGELGLVLQKDAAWRDQVGAPADPQAGNIPGGQRDVLRSANFNGPQSQNSGFVPESGLWSITGGRYNVAPALTGATDAVSLFYADAFVPTYFELLATINATKPTGGFKANAFIVFDYQSRTDFKFAGINVSTSKLEIGRRTANGWIVEQTGVVTGGVKHSTDYNMFLSVNGNAVTLVVNNSLTISHAFAPRVDVDGFVHTISEGMFGLGADNAKASIDNVVVQQIKETIDKTADLGGPTELLQASSSGTWSFSGGRLGGTSTGSEPAINLFNIDIAPSSLLEIVSTFKLTSSTAQGGFVFDYYSPVDFKYVMISAADKKIVIGHRARNGSWVTDATYNFNSFQVGVDYALGVSLRGTTVNVTLNNQTVLSKVFNGLVTDGEFGLFSRFGTASFDSLILRSDDSSFDDDEDGGEVL